MLTAQSLTCRRGARLLFSNAGLTLEPGSLLIVTGPNGCGKSSLLRILAGILSPKTGSVLWQNETITTDPEAHRRRLHYIGHLDALKNQLTVEEMLSYWRALRTSLWESCHRGQSSPDPFGILAHAKVPVRRLSAGQRRKLSLSRLVRNDAQLWLLDEPATALDREGTDILESLVAAHRAKGGIAIAATHQMFDAPGAQQFDMTPKAT